MPRVSGRGTRESLVLQRSRVEKMLKLACDENDISAYRTLLSQYISLLKKIDGVPSKKVEKRSVRARLLTQKVKSEKLLKWCADEGLPKEYSSLLAVYNRLLVFLDSLPEMKNGRVVRTEREVRKMIEESAL